MTRKKSFQYDGRTLDVISEFKDGEWRVQVYEGDKPANQVGYTVSGLTDLDARIAKDVDCVENLMEIAEQDFVRWSDWLKHNPPPPSSH